MLQNNFSCIFCFLISHVIRPMTKRMIKHILGYLVLPIIIKVIKNYKILFHFLLKLWLVYWFLWCKDKDFLKEKIWIWILKMKQIIWNDCLDSNKLKTLICNYIYSYPFVNETILESSLWIYVCGLCMHIQHLNEYVLLTFQKHFQVTIKFSLIFY